MSVCFNPREHLPDIWTSEGPQGVGGGCIWAGICTHPTWGDAEVEGRHPTALRPGAEVLGEAYPIYYQMRTRPFQKTEAPERKDAPRVHPEQPWNDWGPPQQVWVLCRGESKHVACPTLRDLLLGSLQRDKGTKVYHGKPQPAEALRKRIAAVA